jgi:hypothetical protein
MTEPLEPLWEFGLSANYGYEYFMQRPDGRVLLGKNVFHPVFQHNRGMYY